jgi:hypothetical protein
MKEAYPWKVVSGGTKLTEQEWAGCATIQVDVVLFVYDGFFARASHFCTSGELVWMALLPLQRWWLRQGVWAG